MHSCRPGFRMRSGNVLIARGLVRRFGKGCSTEWKRPLLARRLQGLASPRSYSLVLARVTGRAKAAALTSNRTCARATSRPWTLIKCLAEGETLVAYLVCGLAA